MGLLALAIPVMYSSILSYGINLIGIAFVGRLGEFELSVALLATSFHNVTSYAVVTGFSGVLETVCGQSYGARRYRAVGIALQRAVVLTLLLCGAIAAVWIFAAERLILAFGQEPRIAVAAAAYLRLTAPALFAEGLTTVLARYLLAQGHATQPTVASTAGILLAPAYYHILVSTVGLGLDGAAIAQSALQMTLLAVLVALTGRHHRRAAGTPRQTWYGWSAAALRGWGPYTRLGLPSVAMTVVEWSAFEVCVIEAGWLPEPSVSLSVMGLLLNITTLLYMIPMGIGAGASTRVSNALGAGLVNAARRSAFVALSLAVVVELGLAGLLFALNRTLIPLLTTADEVISAASLPLLVATASLVADAINAVSSGVFRGAGRQSLGATIALGFYWGLALPLGYALTFHGPHAGVAGLWLGLLCGGYAQGTVNAGIIAATDWRQQAERAAALTHGNRSGADDGAESDRIVLDP